MPYGLYISAEGAKAQTTRLETIAHNLANVDTVGFKQDLARLQALWITEADVTSLMSLPEAIEALERVLAMEARGEAANMGKTHVMVGANDVLQAIGASVFRFSPRPALKA